MRLSTLVAAIAAAATVALAFAPAHAESKSTKTRTRHVTAVQHPSRITVTRRSYLDPGTEVLPQAHASQSLYPLGFMNHNANYDLPGSPGNEISNSFFPFSDPFFQTGWW
jgi:predicted alpha/beta-hydrolase family hydrolase